MDEGAARPFLDEPGSLALKRSLTISRTLDLVRAYSRAYSTSDPQERKPTRW